MIPELKSICCDILKHVDDVTTKSETGSYWSNSSRSYEAIVVQEIEKYPEVLRERLRQEFLGFGPLSPIFEISTVTETLILGPENIWVEDYKGMKTLNDCFLSEVTFNNFFHRLCQSSGCQVNMENPMGNGRLEQFRVHICHPPVTDSIQISMRRISTQAWNLEEFERNNWASIEVINHLRILVSQQKSLLIVGPTSAGKTTCLNALLQEIPKNDRCIIIEDTPEIHLPNNSSCRLLTRPGQMGYSEINQEILIKEALRMRPDRLILGEVRGGEAKDLLLALSSGHSGSLCTIHGSSAMQALKRLEILVQMGAPQWSLQTIRRLIFLSLDGILVVEKREGQRRFKELVKIQSLESTGFLLEPWEISISKAINLQSC